MTLAYDLLVVDLDGTLLSPDGSVSAANREAIASARAAGIEVIVATGRALVESLDPLSAIDHGGVAITAGGAMRCDVARRRTIARTTMAPALVTEVTDALLHHGHKVLLLKDPDHAGYDYLAVGPGDLDPSSAWWFEHMPVRVRFVSGLEEDPHPGETVRVGAVATGDELGLLARQLSEDICERGFIQHWGAVFESTVGGRATHLLEVFSPDVNKWTMVAAYCAEQGIPRERVAAIGDGLNDVQLIRESALGIAMGNADLAVHDVSDRTTESHERDGVAFAVARILDGRW
ncbi:MAG: HAD family phosphatase [Phycisphaerales bacterium]|nr:Cof-type HAD-IIB family hydrolase [Phycisphaerae bacterium]NNF41656.1 HAD family phosphatase [Phycisphaerales bacterium]NNM25194.1 HAD family phosphatase [Phycisphaerales bacterium]